MLVTNGTYIKIFKCFVILCPRLHKLSNISRSKSNETMRFGQSIEYNMRNENFFLENRIQNVVKKLIRYPFIKTQN